MLPARLTARRAPLRHALVVVSLFASLLAVTEAFLGPQMYPDDALVIAAYPLVGLAFVVVGCVAWSRRPSNHTGILLIVTGALVMTAALGNIVEPHLIVIGVLFGQAPIAAVLHLAVAFPSGRLEHRADRALVVTGYVLTIAIQVPTTYDSPAWLGSGSVFASVVLTLKAVVLVLAAARVVVRVRSTGRGSDERRVLAAVSWYGGALLLFLLFSAGVLTPLFDLDPVELFALQMMLFVLAPFVYAAGVLRGGFARTGELHELASWLVSLETQRTSLRDALAQVLGDDTLEVRFVRPGSGVLIDADGQPAPLAVSPQRGAVPIVDADGRTAATLVYDRVLLADPSVVEQAGRVVALALARERLDAELLAEREAVRASRARVVEVGDLTRRQLAQDLHDVLQSRLTLAALHAGRLAADSTEPGTRAGASQLRDELDALITEFRGVVHGVMPALLVERGLAAAAEDLVDRQPVPARLRLVGADTLSPALATTAYFILAEALTNAVRHAAATTLEVSIEQRGDALVLEVHDDGVGGATPTGAGLRGIADRVDAHAGRLHVDSPVGGGTRLRVELPCAS